MTRTNNSLAERITYGTLSVLTVAGALFLIFSVAAARKVREAPEHVANWAEVQGGHVLHGAEHATAVMVVFSDFECPSCARLDGWLEQLSKDMGANLAVSIRHYPLSAIHPFAVAAAVAAECAGEQGLYVPYHHALFRTQANFGAVRWSDVLGGPSHLGEGELSRCIADPDIRARVSRDSIIGRRAGVKGTPTIVLNGMRLPYMRSYDELHQAAAAAVRQVAATH